MYSSKLLLRAVNECRRVTSETVARATTRYIVGTLGRYMSTTHTRATNTDKRDDHCSRKWDYQVTPFGRLIVNTGDHLDVRIESLCPDEYPHMDRFVMDACQAGVVDVPGAGTASLLDRIECQQQDDNIVVTVADVSGNDRCSTAECHIKIPVKFGEQGFHVATDYSQSSSLTLWIWHNKMIINLLLRTAHAMVNQSQDAFLLQSQHIQWESLFHW